MNLNMYALIMAGGEGKRFWPLSSREKPKQFLSLTGDKSLIRQTVDRVLPLIPIENIFIVTVSRYAEETLRHIPELPLRNLVLEPEGKNTAPCIAYGTLRIMSSAEDPVIVVLPADHAVGDDEGFRSVLRFAGETASRKLANGNHPLIKSTDNIVSSAGGFSACLVERFTEKPDSDTALRFLKEGGYYWNSGVFVWRASSIISDFSRIIPEWYGQFGKISSSLGTASEDKVVLSFYKSLEPGSIDKLILEHSENTVVIPVNYPWSDVGSWKTLDDFLRKGADDNIVHGEAVTVDSSGCLVFGSGRVIALVGVRDLVVVDSPDGILILDKERSQDVRKVAEELSKKNKD
jgi:mannose-1-phosphate guanylyltransferase